jgi:hypothetical protein
MASDAKFAKETQAYKNSLDACAQGVRLARDNALKTYEGVQVIVDKMYWKPSKEYRNVKDLYLAMRIVNTSGVYVELPSVMLEYRDSNKRKVNFDIWRERIELAPGDVRSVSYALPSTEFKEYSASAEGGTVAVQIRPSKVEVKDLPDYVGKLTAAGEPFLPQKPRDPFWLDEKEITFFVGSAEMAAGVYDQNVSFPPYGWWPVPGLNGGYSGKLPGRMATVKAPQPMPAYVNNGNQQEHQGKDNGMTVQETTEAVKATGEAAKAGLSLIKSIGDLF